MGKVSVFAAGLLLLLGTLSVGTNQALMNHDDLVPRRYKSIYRLQKETRNSLDILILGDSLTYSTFSPMELWQRHGYTAYVASQSAQKIWETEEVLKLALKQQKPKLVLLETNALFRKNTGDKKLSETLESVLGNALPVFREHDVWKSVAVNKKHKSENMIKGFLFRTKVVPYTKGEYMLKTKEKKEISDTAISRLRNILRMCRKNGIRLVLVSAPSPKNCSYEKHNALAGLAKRLKVRFLDMNLLVSKIGIDWKTDTIDRGDHLNLSGAIKCSRYLGNHLSGKYRLTDHRKEAAFSSWKKEARVYRKKVDEGLAKIRGSM